MTDTLWFLTRSSGIVALVLIVAAVADGLLFSGRNTGRRRRPAWWMDLHRGLGGYALFFTGLHLVTAFGADLGVGLAEIFVPGAASSSTTAYTLGVLALYGIAATVLSSWPKRRLRRRTWHLVHVLSLPAAVAAGVHAYQLGTDARTTWYTLLTLCLVAVGSYPLALRLIGVARKRLDRATAAPTPAVVVPDDLSELDQQQPERELVGAGR
ncbi:MAG: ferric reductase-like transmembrane domain-containing protein [Acidimicrobiales bacterium]